MRFLLYFVVIAAIFWLYVQVSPTDPDRWHVDPESAPDPGTTGRRIVITTPDAPQVALARLVELAAATPRTSLLAGSVEEGRMTFVTRSRAWGFPDYTTVSVVPSGPGSKITMLGRLRFGRSDLGVNARRLGKWQRGLSGGELLE